MSKYPILPLLLITLGLLLFTPQPLSAQTTGWEAVYFNNIDRAGRPVIERVEPAIRNWWGLGSPGFGVQPDFFSATYRRVFYLDGGLYRFRINADDGVRLFINGQMIVNALGENQNGLYIGEAQVPIGPNTVELHYVEYAGDAHIAFEMVRIAGSDPSKVEPLTEIATVDDVDAGFIRTGNPPDWRLAEAGFRNRTFWSYSNRTIVNNANEASWYPSLPYPGLYRVEVYIPWVHATTRNAIYKVYHAGTATTQHVNQFLNNGRWVGLGTYFFEDTSEERVELSDITYEGQFTEVAFDAVRFVPLDGSQAPVVPAPPVAVTQATITLSAPNAALGQTLIATVTNLRPGARARLYLAPAGTTDTVWQYGSAIVGLDGRGVISFTIPFAYLDGTLIEGNQINVLIETSNGVRAQLPLTLRR